MFCQPVSFSAPSRWHHGRRFWRDAIPRCQCVPTRAPVQRACLPQASQQPRGVGENVPDPGPTPECSRGRQSCRLGVVASRAHVRWPGAMGHPFPGATSATFRCSEAETLPWPWDLCRVAAVTKGHTLVASRTHTCHLPVPWGRGQLQCQWVKVEVSPLFFLPGGSAYLGVCSWC